MKEHEALGKLDEVFEQMQPEERERALAWLRAKYPAQKAAPVFTPPLKLEPPPPWPPPHYPPPGVIIETVRPEIHWSPLDPYRTTCGGAIDLQQQVWSGETKPSFESVVQFNARETGAGEFAVIRH